MCHLCAYRQLLGELLVLNAVADQDSPTKEEKEQEMMASSSNDHKGMLQDRFGGGTVVVNAPKNIKPSAGRELQLPSMIQLTAKTSSQQFLLRILKVIIQLREAAKQAAKKQKRPGESVKALLSPGFLPYPENQDFCKGLGETWKLS